MKKPQFLKYEDDRYIGLTGESVPNLPSIVIGFTGPSPGELAEVAEPIGRLPGEIVEGRDLPDEWKDAFRKVGFDIKDEEVQKGKKGKKKKAGCTDCATSHQRIAELELDCAKYLARAKHAGPPEPGIFWILTTIAAVTMIVIMHLAQNG